MLALAYPALKNFDAKTPAGKTIEPANSPQQFKSSAAELCDLPQPLPAINKPTANTGRHELQMGTPQVKSSAAELLLAIHRHRLISARQPFDQRSITAQASKSSAAELLEPTRGTLQSDIDAVRQALKAKQIDYLMRKCGLKGISRSTSGMQSNASLETLRDVMSETLRASPLADNALERDADV